MPLPIRPAAVLVASFAVAGCVSQQQMVQQKEDLLAAAGFVARPASTPERLAMLQHLPPNKFVMREKDGRVVYIYADPIACNCVYFGNDTAFTKYKQERFQQDLVNRQQEIADEQQLTAEQDSWGGWGWGAWGGAPFGPGFY